MALCGGASALWAADPQPYTVSIDSTGNSALDAALAASSQLESLRKSAPAGPFALVGRTQQDLERLQVVLESFGYYQRAVTGTIDDRPIDDPTLPDIITALPSSTPAHVHMAIQTGPLFHLRHVTVQGDISTRARAAFALSEGAPAVASDVLAARQRLLDALQEEGYAFASVDLPAAFLVGGEPLMDVSFSVEPGAHYDIGAVRFEGLKRVNESFLRRRLLLHIGDAYSPSAIERERADLLSLGTFSGISVKLPKAQEVADGHLTVTFTVQERPRNAVTFSAAYSSDLGGSGGASWSDRDLFGNAEQLTITANAIDIGGSDTNGLGYDLESQLLKPDFLRPSQSLQFRLSALQQQLDAYNQTAAIGGATLSRKLSSFWTVSIGANIEQENILQEGVRRYYTLFSVPLGAKYDSTGQANPLLDPRHGLRVSLSIAPTEALGVGRAPIEVPAAPGTTASSSSQCVDSTSSINEAPSTGHANFLIVQGTVSTYYDLSPLLSGPTGPTGRTVLALRALAGLAQGASQFSLPPDQRFYGGGSATVRGYRYQSIGPVFDDCNPKGGTAIEAVGAELRQRIGTNFGAALFMDAGQVFADARPFDGGLDVGYGGGVRYYTPIGAIRFDVAVPAHRLAGGDALEVYVGLGQSF